MAQPTIKKKTLKVKKAGSPATSTPATDAAGSDMPGATGGQPPMAAMDNMPQAKSPSYTLGAILGLLALIMLVGLLIIQYTEFTFLSPLFPKPPQAGM